VRLVLIGPTYPFRGGIAHHTTFLCKALRKKHHVKLISYKRQFPKIIFPGKSDIDQSKRPIEIDGVERIIDSINPLTWKKALNNIKKYKPDQVVLPWWVAFWAFLNLYISIMVKKYCNSEIVIICHNVDEHESNFIKKYLAKMNFAVADRIITQNQHDSNALKKILRNQQKIVTAYHPTYLHVGPKWYDKEEAKKRLGIKGSAILFFGFVRRYKGLDILIDSMPEVIEKRDALLLVVGEFWDNKRKYIKKIRYYGIENQVMVIDKYIPNEDVGLYFGACDLVVLPYLSGSGSGICQLAFGFERPVIASRVGGLAEAVNDGHNGRISNPGDAKDLAKAIIECLEPGVIEKLSRNVIKEKEVKTWDGLADIISPSTNK
jgi:glycosyltransferase involved in cell wall biosynthesis